MAERSRSEIRPEETNLPGLRRWFLNLFESRGEEDITERTREARAARALATGAPKKGGIWENYGSPTLGGASASALLGAVHGGEWLKKWVWGKNRAYWNSITPALKGIKFSV